MAAVISTHSRVISMIGKDFLQCSICAGPFEDPRALPCLHAFCTGCLAKWAKECSKDNTTLSCALCKNVYQIPEEGIKGFPIHFLLANLQNTVESVKQTNLTPGFCDKHGKKKNYYCENCDCAACSGCPLFDFTHRGHTFIELNQAAFQQSRPCVGRVPDIEKKYVTPVQEIKQTMPQDFEDVAEVKIKSTREAGKEPVKHANNIGQEATVEIKARNNHVKQLNNLASPTCRSPSAASPVTVTTNRQPPTATSRPPAKSRTIGANCPPSLATNRSLPEKSMTVPAKFPSSLASSQAKPVPKSAQPFGTFHH